MLKENSLHIRWLGKCKYEDIWTLQNTLYKGDKNYLLLVEHPPVYTFGVRGKKEHLLKDETELAELGAEVIWCDRGGDVTFHGLGQLVGYPILNLEAEKGGLVYTAKYIDELQGLLKEVIEVNLGFGRNEKTILSKKNFPGLWVSADNNKNADNNTNNKNADSDTNNKNANNKPDKKIASIGVKLNRGRTMHGFALNVSTDLNWFNHIVPCGLNDVSMTSLKEQGLNVSVLDVARAVADVAVRRWIDTSADSDITEAFDTRTKLAILPAVLSANEAAANGPAASPEGLKLNARKPEWLRAPVTHSPNKLKLKKILKDLPTVCEEAGCPNLSECWSEGTATFMINGERCTRNCGFCLVDTRKPLALDESEPERLAKAVENMGLKHVVITAVARDDLIDGGADAFVETIRAVRNRCPSVSVEVLIPDFKGRLDILDLVLNEQPEVLNHNLETCLRLQKQVRPQASYARSLSVLAHAKEVGLTTKSSLMMGLGETIEEIKVALADLGQVGTDIVTIGQYLRPSQNHLPVSRWVEPEEFEELGAMAGEFNIRHIEAGPLIRSSYRAGKIQLAIANQMG